MQFGTILSDTSDSETECTWESNNSFRPEMIGRYDTKSGSDIPSDEEEDVNEKEIEVIFVTNFFSYIHEFAKPKA